MESNPNLANEVSIQKVERGLEKAVGLDADGIKIAIQQDIEVR